MSTSRRFCRRRAGFTVERETSGAALNEADALA
jgi:hypothetical protein